jgi:hypothetical protein
LVISYGVADLTLISAIPSLLIKQDRTPAAISELVSPDPNILA